MNAESVLSRLRRTLPPAALSTVVKQAVGVESLSQWPRQYSLCAIASFASHSLPDTTTSNAPKAGMRRTAFEKNVLASQDAYEAQRKDIVNRSVSSRRLRVRAWSS